MRPDKKFGKKFLEFTAEQRKELLISLDTEQKRLKLTKNQKTLTIISE
jgi:hypothetical protein